jgi:signal transduction histidine kinase/CheY-like chemotaxis protein
MSNFLKPMWKLFNSNPFKESIGVRLLPDFLTQLSQEDNRTQIRFIYFAFSLKLLQFIMGLGTVNQVYTTFLVMTVLMLLLWKKQIVYVNILYFLVNCILPNTIYERMEMNLLALPVQIMTFPIYCIMVTRSVLLAALATGINAISLYVKIRPILAEKLMFSPNQEIRDATETMIVATIEAGLLVFVSLVFQVRSRETDMLKFFETKKKLDELNVKLESLNDQLHASMKGKDDFLLNVSHELRNPMNILLGNLELAIANPKDPNLPTHLENAKISGELLTFLINNLLDAGKLQHRKLEINPVPTNTFTFIERIWSTCKMLIQKRNLEGQVFIDKSIPESLVVDSHRLMQILLNLVSNSSKFTAKGGILMVVTWVKDTVYSERLLEKTPDELFNLAFNPYDVESATNHNASIVVPERNTPISSSNLQRINSFSGAHVQLSTDEDTNMGPTISPKKYASMTIYKTLSLLDLMKKYYKLDYNFPRFPNVHHHLSNFEQPDDEPTKKSKEGFLKIEIKDTGCGMSNKDLERLFKRFAQVGTIAVHRQIGTGLGLWITHSLCESMGGGVKAYSSPGQGSTFVAAIKCQQASSAKGKEGHKMERAMVVDDIPTNQKLNKYFLERYGVKVTDLAGNGLEAFETYVKKGDKFFDIIFMDVDMPVMSGSEAAEKIRAHERKYQWKAVSIIIITGACTKEECDRFIDKKGSIRANYVFQKPFSLHQCRDLIEQLNNQSKTSAHSNGPKSIGESSSKRPTKKVILIVDDDRFNIKLLSDYLTNQKIEVLTAFNGRDAIQKYQQFHLDIKMIFMDCEMPVMNGFTATEKIRELIDDNIWPDIKIVGLTGNATEESKAKCKKAGMNSVITKPISYDFLQNTIDNFFFA